jgi:UDP-N-acetylmuramoylalanine--D-glutamate ligase
MSLNNAPNYSAITNITQNHLDWHTNMAEYIASKLKIFSKNTKKSVIPKNFPYIDLTCVNKKDIITFFLGENSNGIGLCGENITFNGESLLDIRKIKLVGEYNILNFMTAIGLTYPYIQKSDINNVAESFCGVEHRCEFVAEKCGVKFYDSSIDSTPSRTNATLSCFPDSSVVLILGGYDKNLDYKPLAIYSPRKVLKYVLIGTNKWKIYNSLITNGIPLDRITVCSDFADAIYCAYQYANGKFSVLLSPASASFDMFIDYDERGKIFKNIIKYL